MVVLLLACQRAPIDQVDDSPKVDAEIYALGFCSLKYYRLTECGLLDEPTADSQERACIDDALEALPADPCWAEWIELRRCLVREATCEDVEDEMLADGDGALCEHREQVLDACEP